MKNVITLTVLAMLLLPAQAQFKTLKPDVWLRADQFDYKNKIWKDLSGNKRDASKVQGNYSFTDSLVNGNPAVFFNGNNTALRINYEPKTAENLTVITVYQSTDTRDQGIWRATMGDDYDAMLTTQRVMNLQSLRRYTSQTIPFPVINNTVQNNDQPVKSLKGYIVLGGKDTIPESTIFKGKIAECFVFYRELTGKEKKTVQSYLALKYGVTLMYSDYVDYRGNPVWSYEQNSEYAYSIAGIGRDDSTSLYQKQSTSNEQDGLVSMAATKFFATNAKNTTTIDNNNYLIWSDNGQALGYRLLEDTPYQILNRKWLVTANGTSISSLPVNMRVKSTGFFTVAEDSVLLMAISRTGDPEFKDAVYYAADSINSKGYACFNNLRWDTDRSGKDLFTFAVLPKVKSVNMVENSVTPDGGYPPVAVTNPSNGNELNAETTYEYKLWPNPTSGDYKLQLSYPEPTEVTVSIFNSSGILVKQFKGRDSNTYYFTDHIQNTGYYMVRIESSYGTETMKIVVVK